MPIRRPTLAGRAALPFALLVLFAACDESSPSPVEELPPPTVSLAAPTQTLLAGEALQVSATVTEEDGSASTRAVQWESNDSSVATVNGSGRVTGVGAGRATITARVGGASAEFAMTVMRAPVPGGPQSTFLRFTSTPDDYIGMGESAHYTSGDGEWSAFSSPLQNEVRVALHGLGPGSWWNLELAAPQGQVLGVGTYTSATRWPFQAAASPGLSFGGSGRGCNTLTGSFVVHDVAIDHEGRVHRLHATFRQHCEGRSSYLEGELAILLQPLR